MRLAALDPGRRDDVGSTPPISRPWTARVCGNKRGCVQAVLGFGKMLQLTTYWLMIPYGVALRKIGRKKKSEDWEEVCGSWRDQVY